MEGLQELGYIGLFIASFLSATIIPLASEAIFGAMAVLEDYNIILLILFATLGNWFGGITTFYLGKLGKWQWIEKYMRVKRSRVEKMKVYMDRYGAYSALASWVPIIGDVIALALGLFSVKTTPVIIYMLIGKLLRYTIIGVLLVYTIEGVNF